jgi:hypothetical protein
MSMEGKMSRGNLIAIGVVAVLVLIVGFLAYCYRTTNHVWKIDTTVAPELARTTLEHREGLSNITVAKEAGALTVRYSEHNGLFRSQVDPEAVLKEVAGGKEVRVIDHRTE